MAITVNLNRLPTGTGIYRFSGPGCRILYVGKAINIRKRLRDHRRSQSIKIKQLLQEATAFDYELISSEAAALLREAELIKRHQPRYNTLLRDDSQYFYVTFSNEPFPKVSITRQPKKITSLEFRNSKFRTSQIIGPFTEGRTLRLVLATLRRFLPFCTCVQPHRRECLNAHLGLCPGWCCKQETLNSKSQIPKNAAVIYQRTIKQLQQILGGDLTKLKQKLLTKLAHELKQDNLERATQLRREIEAINALTRQIPSSKFERGKTAVERLKVLRELQQLLRLTALPERIEAYDCSHFGGTSRVGTMVAFRDGQYAPTETRYFKIRGKYTDDLAMLEEMLERRLNHPEWNRPDLILVDGGITQYRRAYAVLRTTKQFIPLISFAKPQRPSFAPDGASEGRGKLYHHPTIAPLRLANLPVALQLFLEEIDARVHRAAIGFHRRTRERAFLS